MHNTLSPWVRFSGFALATAVRCWMRTLDFKIAYYDSTIDPVHPQCRENTIYLRHICNSGVQQRTRRGLWPANTVETHFTRPNWDQTEDGLKQSRLAGTVVPYQCQDFARTNRH